LRDKGPLRPDFYLSELVLFIEFDLNVTTWIGANI
jgi:hypothetical protein